MDAQTAIKVTGDSIEVVSEGHWKLLNPPSLTPETVSLRSKLSSPGCRSHSFVTAMQSTSTSKGPVHSGTQKKMRAGGFLGKSVCRPR